METNKAGVSGGMSDSENEYDEADTHSLKDEDDIMADNNLSESLDDRGEVKKKYDPKDPMRPRRKKARRACFACQRAHLTCGKPHSRAHPCSLIYSLAQHPLLPMIFVHIRRTSSRLRNSYANIHGR